MRTYTFTIEKPELPRKGEILAWFESGQGDNYSLEEIMLVNEKFFKGTGFKVGRGGNHVWIANEEGERFAIITECHNNYCEACGGNRHGPPELRCSYCDPIGFFNP